MLHYRIALQSMLHHSFLLQKPLRCGVVILQNVLWYRVALQTLQCCRVALQSTRLQLLYSVCCAIEFHYRVSCIKQHYRACCNIDLLYKVVLQSVLHYSVALQNVLWDIVALQTLQHCRAALLCTTVQSYFIESVVPQNCIERIAVYLFYTPCCTTELRYRMSQYKLVTKHVAQQSCIIEHKELLYNIMLYVTLHYSVYMQCLTLQCVQLLLRPCCCIQLRYRVLRSKAALELLCYRPCCYIELYYKALQYRVRLQITLL